MAVTSAGKDVDLMGRGKGQQWMANREGREPGEEAEWPGSWPNGKGLNGLHQLLTAPQISPMSCPAAV